MTTDTVRSALATAGRAMGGARLDALDQLKGSHRSVVVRATVDGGPRTVVVKAYVSTEATDDLEGWAREAAALSVLRGRRAPVPVLLADVNDPLLVVTEDLGGGPSVADAVLGSDPNVAADRVMAWARALAAVHGSTIGTGPAFAAALNERAPMAGFPVDNMAGELAQAARTLQKQLPELGVVPERAALADLVLAAHMLAGTAVALTPSDPCPDNNIATDNGLVLIDFEWAAVRPVVWDIAYLDVPWPTCWCSWRIPEEVAAAALTTWRTAVAPAFPAVATSDFDDGLALASVAWALLTTGWFLEHALAEEPRPDGFSPSSRARILHRLGRAVGYRGAVPPRLTDLAEATLTAAGRRWGDLPLDLAPAFRPAAPD